jgi:hypothetical protein
MEMPKVLLKFNNSKVEIALPRVPVAGDWIDVRGKEYPVSKVVMKEVDTSAADDALTKVIVTINADLHTEKTNQIAGPRFG